METAPYGRAVTKVFKELGIPTSHRVHIGRTLGAKLCDLAELPSDEIRKLGNWSPTIQETYYSTKLPLRGIRAMAGFSGATGGIYYNMRTTVRVPHELQRETPISAFVFDAINTVNEAIANGGDHATAKQVLDFFLNMNVVFIQDMAVMMIRHSERLLDEHGKRHPLMKQIEMLNSERFKVSGHKTCVRAKKIVSNRYYWRFSVFRRNYAECFRPRTWSY